MRTTRTSRASFEDISGPIKAFIGRRLAELGGVILTVLIVCTVIALVTWSVDDPSLNHATGKPVAGDDVMVKITYLTRGAPFEVELPFVISAK